MPKDIRSEDVITFCNFDIPLITPVMIITKTNLHLPWHSTITVLLVYLARTAIKSSTENEA